MKRSGFGLKHGNFKNPPKSFGVTKKDRCLIFHIHDLNLFKSWPNLEFDQDSNGHKNSKNQKKYEKPRSYYVIYIVIINKVSRHIQNIQIMYLPPNPKLCLMNSSMKRSGFGFQTWKFQKNPKNFILE
jgi:hypothetical protein